MLPTHVSGITLCHGLRTLIRTDSIPLAFRAHPGTEFPVTINDDVAVQAWKRQRRPQLLHNPPVCRVRSGAEPQNTPPMVLDDEEAILHAKTQRGYGEEIEAGYHLAVILEERQPALTYALLGWRFSHRR